MAEFLDCPHCNDFGSDCGTCGGIGLATNVRKLERVVISAAPHASRAPARTHLPACNVLALDLGTHCGWATAKRDGTMEYGTESFHRYTGGAKWAEYRAWLSSTIKRHAIEVVYFEDVKAHGPGQVLAAHAYGAFLAITEMVCHQHRVRMVGVGVGQVKKSWTGRGNAKKADMMAEAGKRGFRPDTDNAADALAIAAYGIGKERA